MAGDITTYLGNKIIRWLDGNAMPTAPTTTYLALFNNGSEVTTTIRVAGRVAISWAAPASGTDNDMVSDADVDFGAAAGAATVDEVRVYDAASSGNPLLAKAIADITVDAGETLKFLAGDLTFIVP